MTREQARNSIQKERYKRHKQRTHELKKDRDGIAQELLGRVYVGSIREAGYEGMRVPARV